MINKKVESVLNAQINKEFYSAYLYLAMSAFFDQSGLYGFAHWTKVQAREEVEHGMIIFDYIIDRNGTVDLQQINVPEKNFENPLQVFNKIYEHERSVTESIECVASMSEEECDLATRNFINWYIAEQVEEESNVMDVISKLKMFEDNKAALYLFDKELMQREYKSHSYNK